MKKATGEIYIYLYILANGRLEGFSGNKLKFTYTFFGENMAKQEI